MTNLPGTPPPTNNHRRVRILVAIVAVLAVALVARLALRKEPPKPEAEPEPDPFALPVLAQSPFLNTGPNARYVGSDSCLACHAGRHESFRHSGMGRSMSGANIDREPPDAAFDHPASKRRYQIRRKDGQMWHRELLLTAGPEVVLSEFPVKYVVGSGRHSLT